MSIVIGIITFLVGILAAYFTGTRIERSRGEARRSKVEVKVAEVNAAADARQVKANTKAAEEHQEAEKKNMDGRALELHNELKAEAEALRRKRTGRNPDHGSHFSGSRNH